MTLVEINFDGIVGASHNYAGLSLGNLAATANMGRTAYPRAAALQGVEKMRAALRLGLVQGLLVPHRRPNRDWLARLGTDPAGAPESLRAAACSASPMWAANAATVSPAPDTADARCHIVTANLSTMAHRSHEWEGTLAQLRLAFADERAFAVHPPVPGTFGDEGAANHMRMAPRHDAPGVEIFVHGLGGGPFPARQRAEASRAIARLNRLDPERTLFVQQSDAAIAAGAFHNDVVAVANETVLFAHEQAFADKEGFYAALKRLLPEAEIVEVPADVVSLADAVRSYLFNAQLVTLAQGGMALILPGEARETASAWAWLEAMAAGNGPIRKLVTVDLRQSMANGGGPACLRLRVVADPASVDSRFLVDEGKLDRIAQCIGAHWPEAIAPPDLADPDLWRRIEAARLALLNLLDLGALA
jgi:succinylarginine dihydrolase